ncbi:FAD/NAD-P-binding domain-containing protein [Mycena metata]|uniref:FAD/NAD-P-binding domain-containing protein n=1 Tax=Mycena metata TaxID=1033252 RepID=A0AAD7I9Z0_9AGAR|nr:FAD/NAD-P-binding domain-containing protein [Mycena metata]
MELAKLSLVLLSIALCAVAQAQSQNVFEEPQQAWTVFHHPIRRVAVVGAGPSGLQAAAKLIEHNFTVRLFEAAEHPGGIWHYSEETPLREAYPDKPIEHAADIPIKIPATRYYCEGDNGLTLDDRWRQHWRPRPMWDNLHANSPKASTELPDVQYDRDAPWVLSQHAIQRHVRSYASHHCLNSNDRCPAAGPPVVSYSTRVEKVEKDTKEHKWILTLRRLERLRESNRILEEWWTETFDAVVLATGPYVSAHVPDIEGIVDWSKAKEGERYSMCHSQSYRHPERYENKTILLVGASISASEIARDIGPFVHRLLASVRDTPNRPGVRQRSLTRFPAITEFIPEIASFEPLQKHGDGIRKGKIHLVNGSVMQGVDEIILATGFQGYSLYPPNTSGLPLLHFLRSNPCRTTWRPQNLYFTGHWIPDSTIAYTNRRPWTLGRYQSYAFAKVWEGSARLPSPEQIEKQEHGSASRSYWLDMWLAEAVFRRFVSWLNDASLEHGGRFVQPPPIENLELFRYYTVVHLNNTVRLEDLDMPSLLSKQSATEDAWNEMVYEDADW